MSADLAYQVLRYAQERLQRGDMNALRDLGFLPAEIREIEQMSFREVRHLAEMSVHFLDVQIDRQLFHRALGRAREEAETEDVQDELLRLGAPNDMIEELFGLAPSDVAERRRVLDIAARPGRPRTVPTETERAIWDAWRASGSGMASEAERYLRVARETGQSAQAVWSVVQDCQRAGMEDRLTPEVRDRVVGRVTHAPALASIDVGGRS